MKFQRSTLLLLFLAILFAGVVYVSEVLGPVQREAAQTRQQQLFGFEKQEIQAFSIAIGDQTLKFERSRDSQANPSSDPAPEPPAATKTPNATPSSPSPDGAADGGGDSWQMIAPKPGPANVATVDFLLDLIVTAESERSLTLKQDQLSETGLEKPLATIELTLVNQDRHRLVLGQPDFSGNALYAQVDPPDQVKAEVDVVLVPLDFQSAVVRPLSDWQQAEAPVTDPGGASPNGTSQSEPAPEGLQPPPEPRGNQAPSPQISPEAPADAPAGE